MPLRHLDPTQKHVKMLRAALELREGEEYAAALDLLLKVVQLEPDLQLGYIFLGLVYQDLDNEKEAEQSFRKALSIDSQSVEALQSLGLLLLSQDRLAEAFGILRRLVNINPGNQDVLDMLVPALVNAGRLEDADQILSDVWEKTRQEDIAVRYARFLVSIARVDQAHDFLLNALEDIESPHLLVELALTLVIEEKYSEAIAPLQRALEIRHDYDRAIRGLSHCYSQLNMPEKAIEEAERAIAVAPGHYRNWQAKADALLLLERYDEASEAAQTGISLIDPHDNEAQPVLAVLHIQRINAFLHLDRVDETLEELSKGREQIPEDSRFYRYPVEILARKGRLPEALQAMKQAFDARIFESEDEQLQLLHLIADVALSKYLAGLVDEAQQAFQGLVGLSPNEPRFLMALGFIQTGEGNLAEADNILQVALEHASEGSRGIILCDLGYLHIIQGSFEQAEQELIEACKKDTGKALLRIAYWKNGDLITDYASHPRRRVSIQAAAQANLATMALAKGKVERALELAEEIIESTPEESIGYEVLGCAQQAGGMISDAAHSWEKAKTLTQNERLRALLESWIPAQ
jgi:tetratricopeptide (TPR) repeat protein